MDVCDYNNKNYITVCPAVIQLIFQSGWGTKKIDIAISKAT